MKIEEKIVKYLNEARKKRKKAASKPKQPTFDTFEERVNYFKEYFFGTSNRGIKKEEGTNEIIFTKEFKNRGQLKNDIPRYFKEKKHTGETFVDVNDKWVTATSSSPKDAPKFILGHYYASKVELFVQDFRVGPKRPQGKKYILKIKK